MYTAIDTYVHMRHVHALRACTQVGLEIADCGTCQYCLDKPRFGGRGTKRQKCARETTSRRPLPSPSIAFPSPSVTFAAPSLPFVALLCPSLPQVHQQEDPLGRPRQDVGDAADHLQDARGSEPRTAPTDPGASQCTVHSAHTTAPRALLQARGPHRALSAARAAARAHGGEHQSQPHAWLLIPAHSVHRAPLTSPHLCVRARVRVPGEHDGPHPRRVGLPAQAARAAAPRRLRAPSEPRAQGPTAPSAPHAPSAPLRSTALRVRARRCSCTTARASSTSTAASCASRSSAARARATHTAHRRQVHLFSAQVHR